MLRQEKEQVVAELVEQLRTAPTLIVADYRGLTNKQLEALRGQLLEHGARFRVVKNTLTRRAAEAAGAEALLVMLEGPTAIAFIESGGDPVAVAKALAQTARETNVLALRGGVMEGRTISAEEVAALATLPPLDVLRGQVVAAVVAPLHQLLALVTAPLRELHGLLEARIRQLEEQGERAEAAPEQAPAAEHPGEPVPEASAGQAAEPEAEAPEAPAEDDAEAAADAEARRAAEGSSDQQPEHDHEEEE